MLGVLLSPRPDTPRHVGDSPHGGTEYAKHERWAGNLAPEEVGGPFCSLSSSWLSNSR